MATVTTTREQRERKVALTAVLVCVAISAVACTAARGPSWLARRSYEPQAGDIVFQSLPRNALVNAIEGVTESSYSHCGIVAKEDGLWIVYEAFRGVEQTPLSEFLSRGRNGGFAVYRLKPEFQPAVPQILKFTRPMLGRRYDSRYRMDDERIYCFELIYKACKRATQKELGQLVRFGDLNWRPFEETIIRFEGGPVPMDRLMITPKAMSLAPQLDRVMSYNIAVPKPVGTD